MTQLTLWDWVCECGGEIDIEYHYKKMWSEPKPFRVCFKCWRTEYAGIGEDI